MSNNVHMAFCQAVATYEVVEAFGANVDAILAARAVFEANGATNLSAFDAAIAFNGDLEAARAARDTAGENWIKAGKPNPV